ncbi:unnamed protein product [Spirodela intermedia]|uniref:Uncharacterized protein n=1 Tax=Spirodela intermedia TaxID=51605 RepID=A0A7I8L1M4_SPIIN|nr:unnamed protein product [Spirodela intermedia]
MSATGTLRPFLAGSTRGIVSAGDRLWRRARTDVVGLRRSAPAAAAVSSRREDASTAPSACSPPPAAAVSDAIGVGVLEPPPSLDVDTLEALVEKVVYSCRFIALLGVSGSLVGSILCFFKGCVYIATAFLEYFTSRGKPMSVIIEAIDVYLIGTVMLVFGMGIYELFISNLDMAKISSQRSNFLGLFTLQERPRWLDIKSVNELKTKLGHVIVMVLLVGLFDKVQKVGIATPIDLLCLTASILLSSGGLFLLSKLSHPRHK